MRTLILACALALSPVAAGAAFAQAHREAASQAWQGVYAGAGNTPTTFTATLSISGNRLSGTMVEPNTFGAQDVVYLLADVAGTVNGERVVFIKTYDGSGGVSHSVRYDGVLSANGRRIAGTWSLDGARGTFEMVR